MKKFIFTLIISISLILTAVICVNAENNEKIQIINSNNAVIKYFDIDTNNLSVNSRTNIQKALNYIKENSNGNILTLKLPYGKYSISSSLDVYSNTILDLSGSTLYRAGSCGSVIRFGMGSDISYGYDGYKNITVKNGTIDANKTGTSSLVRFAHAYNVTFSGITMKNSKDVQHLLTFAACNNVKILNCTFSDMEITKAKDNYNCEAIQIDILKKGHFDYPANDATPTKNVTVSGCTFNNLQRGLGSHSAFAAQYFENMKFTNNTFNNIKGYAISTVNYRNCEITNNTITNCGSGIVCGNTTGSNFSHFYAPANETDKIKPDAQIKIANNSISIKSNNHDNTAFGIDIKGAKTKLRKDSDGNSFSGDFRITAVLIENNTISSTVDHINTYAIRVSGAYGSQYSEKSNFRITGNKIIYKNKNKHNVINDGIKISDSSKIYIAKNKIYDKAETNMNLRNGIIADNCSKLYIASNKISNTNAYGIKFTGISSSTIKSNTLKNNLSDAVHVYTKSKNIKVLSNKIYSCKSYSIIVSDSTVSSIKSNSIYDCAKTAIYIMKDGVCSSISSNYICGGKATAIYLNSNANVTSITKNTIDLTSSKANAIAVTGNASCEKISSNKINLKEKKSSKNLKVKCGHGILINSKKCSISSISSNNIKNCKQNGIYVISSKTKPNITKNNIYSCKNGICYHKCKLSENTIKKYTEAKTKKI